MNQTSDPHRYKPYKAKPGCGYKALRAYVRLFHDYFYYRKVYLVDRQNVPGDKPVMLVSNHQNGLSDALGLVVSVDRPFSKLRMIARADVFKPMFAPVLRWMGILPAYRSLYNGESSAIRNRSTLAETEDELLAGGIVGIYPEAGHQDKRWLGRFSVGYLHIVFEAARKSGFEKEIFVVPSCNHYSDYLDMREQMLIWYGEPVSAKPYYELYRANPIEARKKFNEVIREKVSAMMLNITDLDNYDAIDYLRHTYGVDYARSMGYDPDKLPEKLIADKELIARLDTVKKENDSGLQQIYDDISRLKEGTEKLGIDDRNFGRCRSWAGLVLWFLVLVSLAPLFLIACIPNALVFHAPRFVTSKVEDKMLHSGIHFGASVLLIMPLLYLVTFGVVWCLFSLPVALIHILSLPLLGLFAWRYSRSCRSWRRAWRFKKLKGSAPFRQLIRLRSEIHERLNNILFI